MKAKRQSERVTRSDDANAFIPEMGHGSSMTAKGADAEFFGEEFIGSALAGESVAEDARDEVSDEEDGGPFLVLGEDGSLPLDEEGDVQGDGSEAIHQAQNVRGANWMARGA